MPAEMRRAVADAVTATLAALELATHGETGGLHRATGTDAVLRRTRHAPAKWGRNDAIEESLPAMLADRADRISRLDLRSSRRFVITGSDRHSGIKIASAAANR